ncbi:MAG: glycosyltransferase family 10 [[Clostridium] fimetarium]|nr:glycosyltransferase family 10 [Alistipes timonensis]MCM1405579.1 glycosyltransferase family 10 [[Clostridium] fimetarium]
MKFSQGHQVKLYNWSRPFAPDAWLIDFIEKRGLLNSKPNARIGLYSIFGPFWLSAFDRADARLFVERENLHKPLMRPWLHRFLDDKRIDLSLGFDSIDHPQYMRFPFWVMWTVFSPTATYDDIKRQIAKYNSPDNHSFDDRRFCAYLCSHNDKGRRKMFEQFSAIGRVDCDGKLFHNNDDLKLKYNDDKLEYLRHYRFNLTPENTNHEGYVTEKLFEAIASGCVPIYHGGDNNPEPEILNHEAIIFIETGADNENAIDLVGRLNSDRQMYLEFANQPRFKPEAPELIWNYYAELESRLKTIIANI